MGPQVLDDPDVVPLSHTDNFDTSRCKIQRVHPKHHTRRDPNCVGLLHDPGGPGLCSLTPHQTAPALSSKGLGSWQKLVMKIP